MALFCIYVEGRCYLLFVWSFIWLAFATTGRVFLAPGSCIPMRYSVNHSTDSDKFLTVSMLRIILGKATKFDEDDCATDQNRRATNSVPEQSAQLLRR